MTPLSFKGLSIAEFISHYTDLAIKISNPIQTVVVTVALLFFLPPAKKTMFGRYVKLAEPPDSGGPKATFLGFPDPTKRQQNSPCSLSMRVTVTADMSRFFRICGLPTLEMELRPSICPD